MSTPILPLDVDHLADTHTVFNQPPPLEGYNSYRYDSALNEGVIRCGASWAQDGLLAHGERCGSAEVYEWGFLANEVKPRFESHDRQGFRIDTVKYHEAYHRLMALGLESGLHSAPWSDPGEGAHVARAAQYLLQAQVESGHGCPLTMTFASVPTLRMAPDLADQWLPKVLTRAYDPRNIPHTQKRALTIGMGMTEKQGGSDVRANTSVAHPVGGTGPGRAYALTGHKWFTSAPMCDGFLMLAQSAGGLSCFLVPRWREDGSKNQVQVQRLKNKVGNVANASSEIEMRGALSWMVGEEGRGVSAIIEMVSMTRFDCMIGSSAAQRQAIAQAVNHAAGRGVFGKLLIDQPLMRNVLADMQLEYEGAIAMTLRMAQALDRSMSPVGNEAEQQLLRLGLPTGKYWICKRTPFLVYEAMECMGGNSVTEDFIMARLYRDAPINAIWEGSGNVQALDVLRAIDREPQIMDAWFAELAYARGADSCLDAAVDSLQVLLNQHSKRELNARRITDLLALSMQAALLVNFGNATVAKTFIASRLSGGSHCNYGTLVADTDLSAILDRANPLA